ncbi:transcriptional activator of comK gene [Evansella caseinilytica]|uniref:Transcriptional activator of comK protein n=1 Tax=Evansella caseinilytica TaxID=1503961 RepID=A0A1H3U268_9BACI|nr:BMP family ABC transporter substrate-binding protein [Evansella caseinilytica]SDZ55925.1 transcriptional activator of comK gene [Evansella caseinilytica]
MQQSAQLRWILIGTMIVALIFMATIIFKTTGILQNSTKTSNDKINVAIITSDDVVDQSWGSLAYKGQLKMEEKFPVNVTFYSLINTEKKMKDTCLEAVSNDTKVIIGHGREFSDLFTSLAPSYPDIHFVTIHGTAKHPNQSVYTFEQGDIEYFAALAASLKTKSNKIGLLDAIDGRERNPQFEIGLKHYKPEAEFIFKYVGSRDDSKKAVKLMEEMLQEGVDVVYSKGNAYNPDVIEFAKSHDMYVIGYLDDQSYMAADIVLTSVMNDVSQAYVAIMDDFFGDEGIPAGKIILTEKHGVYKLAPFGPMFSQKEIDWIQEEMDKFFRGELHF